MRHQIIDEAAVQGVDSILRTIPSVGVRRSGQTWKLTSRGRKARFIIVALEPGWIVIKHVVRSHRRPVHNQRNAGVVEKKLLKAGAKLSGLLKPTIDREGYPELRADIPFIEAGNVNLRIYEVLNELLKYSKMDPEFQPAPRSTSESRDTRDLSEILDQCNWPYRRINDSRFSIDLETANYYQQSILEVSSVGRVTLEALLYKGETPPDHQLRALSSYLVYANTHTRMARFDLDAQTQVSVSVKVVFPTVPSPLEVAAGLDALSTAASHSGQSVPLLMDDFVAGEYLTAQCNAV